MESIKKMKENFSVNQWAALNRFLFIYKAVGVGLLVVCLIFGGVCISLANRSPIVILASDNDYFYFQGRHAKVTLTELDIKRFVENFVSRFYNWQALEPDTILKSVGPLVTDGFKENTLLNMRARKEKDFVGKKIQQAATTASVQVNKDSTLAVFDVILRVDGIPLVVPTQIALSLVRGPQTDWNPMGLYVNSLTQFDRK